MKNLLPWLTLTTATLLVGLSTPSMAAFKQAPVNLDASTRTFSLAQKTNSFEYWAERCSNLEGQEALDACDRAIAINSNSAVIWNERGVNLNSLGRVEDALNSLNRAIALNPKYSLALYNRCVAFLKLERNEEAVNSCSKALEINANWGYKNPPIDSAFNNLGVALGRLGRHKEALKAYEAALEINPNNPNAQRNRENTQQRLGRS